VTLLSPVACITTCGDPLQPILLRAKNKAESQCSKVQGLVLIALHECVRVVHNISLSCTPVSEITGRRSTYMQWSSCSSLLLTIDTLLRLILFIVIFWSEKTRRSDICEACIAFRDRNFEKVPRWMHHAEAYADVMINFRRC
jgi:hypothetical protein